MFPPEAVPERIGAYRVLRRLSRGGGADVYLGRSDGPMGFSRDVDLKLVPNTGDGDKAFVEELVREAAIISQLNHPAIVRMFDFFEHEKHLVLVLEHVEGVDLEKLQQHLLRRRQRLADTAVFYMGHEIASALAHAHAATDAEGISTPVVHRNLRPESVLIGWDGHVRLTGFGLGKILGRTPDTQVGVVKGAPGWMAPEQMRAERVTPRADVYGCALLLWSLLARRHPPIEGGRPERVSKLRTDIPPELAAAIDAALEPSADKRKITCLELEQWLEKVSDVEAGREELREKVVILRGTGADDRGTDRTAPRRPQTRTSTSSSRNKAVTTGTTPSPSSTRSGAPELPRPPRMPSDADLGGVAAAATAAATATSTKPAGSAPTGELELVPVAPSLPVPSVILSPELEKLASVAPPKGASVAPDANSTPPIPAAGSRPPPGPSMPAPQPMMNGEITEPQRVIALPSHSTDAPTTPPPKRSLTALETVGVAALSAAIFMAAGVFVLEHVNKGAPSTAPSAPIVVVMPQSLPTPTGGPTATPSASTTASASAAPLDSATIEETSGLLFVKTTIDGSVYLSGILAGPPNETLKVNCGRYYVRIGTAPGAGPPSWLAPGQSLAIPCRKLTKIEVKEPPFLRRK